MDKNDVAALLLRIYDIWPSSTPPAHRQESIGAEWCHLLAGYKNTKLMNEALDAYASGPAGKYAPKPSDLIGIYESKRNSLRQYMALQEADGRCGLCGGFGKVLVDTAPDVKGLFWGNYGSLAIKCPCQRPGEMGALQDGRKVTRDIRGGRLEIWLENGRLYGALHEFKARTKAEAWPPAEQSGRNDQVVSAMDALQTEMDLPPF